MKTHFARLATQLTLVAGAGMLAGCHTPQAALDQANNGAALTVSLQTQLAALRAAQAEAAKARLDSIRRLKTRLVEYEAASAFDERILGVIGDSATAKLASDLRGLADSRAEDDKRKAEQLAALDASLASTLDTVPSQDAGLTATQNAMAVLGQELALEQRARIIADFAKQLNKAIKDNKTAEEAASKIPSAAAPVQGAPAGALTPL